MKIGQPDRALEWARRAEALYPDDMGVTINGALLRAKAMLPSEALDLLERYSARLGKKDGWKTIRTTTSCVRRPRFIANDGEIEVAGALQKRAGAFEATEGADQFQLEHFHVGLRQRETGLLASGRNDPSART
jgi:hypothetical protein